MTDTALLLERYRPYRPWVEVGFWVLLVTVHAVANSITVNMDIRRVALDIPAWRPVVWEFSSNAVILLLLPALVLFTRRFPVGLASWRRYLPLYLVASVVWSVLHVVGMVGVRKLAYSAYGSVYDFGSWPQELFYEYLKDVRSFASMVAVIQIYRFVLLRLQGEASLLQEPDVGPPVESIDRPDRFLVRKLGKEFLVAANDIEWIQASGNYVNLHVRGRDYPLRSTIGGIEARLDPQRFARVHRSYIVHLDQVSMIEPLDTGDARLHLKNGTALPCSRRYRTGLRERVGAPVTG
ncbi:LytTR family DNA-binding domain-containing protein [Tahibacter amnicola]|uniref:LytTR family transcriptional regulator n=1 Tax=Tahibacter amnicola TaxID=2976241 RepID=A0ABY6BC40_9GAMM|nr:LytTR family DNA-binding domain-containing protein [Tahibacter amnicola]UXI66733.1 LytTR family transcriptional regulator [Tahibacter amnicola]